MFKNYIKKNLNKTYVIDIAFLSVLAILFFYFGYHDVFFSEPFGIHYMRQTDSLSFASNYYNHGFKFFSPELYNLKNMDGKAACEFPFTYYITALLYSIFGKQFFIQRIVHIVIAYFGVFCSYRLALLILKDKVYAVLVGLIVFSSTVFNYYAFNYLPDIPALGLVFAGWYFFYKYLTDEKRSSLIFMLLFFTLGSLIKVTYLINLLSIISYSILIVLVLREKVALPRGKKIIWTGLISVFLVVVWNIYMIHYNTINESSSFNTKALPIWGMTKENIHFVWELITNYWYKQYFPKSIFHLFYAIFFLQIILIKKGNKQFSTVLLILFLANLSYLILFYSQFRDHDYYFLAFFPVFILVLINGLKTLQNITSNKIIHLIIQLVVAVLLVSGVNFSRVRVYKRFDKKIDKYSQAGLIIHEHNNSIKQLNIPKESRFIVAPDLCQNGGLFFLDKKGWNLTPDQINIENIVELKNRGAQYLLMVTKDSALLSGADSTGMRIFENLEIAIFKLKEEEENHVER
ncbi:MAG: hypothetical protein C0597_05455 [Marinilabiliales bacterium]|nr:MAG: hypothetical protein C0597_05455 [Marinilabiliales bacterium]